MTEQGPFTRYVGTPVLSPVGMWTPGALAPAFDPESLTALVGDFRRPAHVVRESPDGRVGLALEGEVVPNRYLNGHSAYPLLATLPALYPEWLGDRSFCETHGVRFPYVTGAMANGIATTELVIEIARAGMLGFFGAAGLSFGRVEQALGRLESALGGTSAAWGMNLIHSPNEPALEEAVADLYLRRGVTRVSAAAYLALTPAIVRYAASGLSQDASGRITRRNFVFAKVSRPETARHFLSPAPAAILANPSAHRLGTSNSASQRGLVGARAREWWADEDSRQRAGQPPAAGRTSS